MSKPIPTIDQLYKKIEELERENGALRRDFSMLTGKHAVKVPEAFKPFFDAAQQTVRNYFSELKMDPSRGTIEINDQRYVLVRASAFSKGFWRPFYIYMPIKVKTKRFPLAIIFCSITPM